MKVEVVVMGSPSPTVPMVSVEVRQPAFETKEEFCPQKFGQKFVPLPAFIVGLTQLSATSVRH